MTQRPVRLVTAGVDAEGMARIANEAGGDAVQAVATGDMQGARLVRKGVVDYYLGTCWSGGGGALAAATAILGSEQVGIVATPGMAVDPARAASFIDAGKRAFGFPYEQSRAAITAIVRAILNARNGGQPARDAGSASSTGRRSRAASSSFAERFDVLQESGQLAAEVRPSVESFLDELAAALDLAVDEDHAAQFATHVALAFTRMHSGGEEVEPSAVVAEEVAGRQREHEFVTKGLTARADVLGGKVGQGEIDYLTVHICALVDGQRGRR